jgi:hypothetical protein
MTISEKDVKKSTIMKQLWSIQSPKKDDNLEKNIPFGIVQFNKKFNMKKIVLS